MIKSKGVLENDGLAKMDGLFRNIFLFRTPLDGLYGLK